MEGSRQQGAGPVQLQAPEPREGGSIWIRVQGNVGRGSLGSLGDNEGCSSQEELRFWEIIHKHHLRCRAGMGQNCKSRKPESLRENCFDGGQGEERGMGNTVVLERSQGLHLEAFPGCRHGIPAHPLFGDG